MLLGLSETETIDANLSNRLYDLHSRRGTRLLFLGYSRRDPREQLLEFRWPGWAPGQHDLGCFCVGHRWNSKHGLWQLV